MISKEKVTSRKLSNLVNNKYLISVQLVFDKFSDVFDTRIYGDVTFEKGIVSVPLVITPMSDINNITTNTVVTVMEDLGLGARDLDLTNNDRNQIYITAVFDNPDLMYSYYNKVHSVYIKTPISDEEYEDNLTMILNFSNEQVLGGLSVYKDTKLSGNTLAQVVLDTFLGRYSDLPVMVITETNETRTVVYPDRDRQAIIIDKGVATFLGGMSSVSVDLSDMKGTIKLGEHYKIVLTGKGKNPTTVTIEL